MSIFFILLLKLVPLYLIILLGFLASHYLKAQKETIAKLLIYIIAPVVVFYGTYTAELNLANLSLPILFFVIASLLALLFLFIGSRIYGEDSTKNILAFTAGTGNTGYFGLPVALVILGDNLLSLTVLALLGFILYENSVGFFLTARGNHSPQESFLKLIKLPTIYTFILGLLFNVWGIHLGDIGLSTLIYFKGAYTVLGMMIIGMGLNFAIHKIIDYRFFGLSFAAKFLVWPVVIGGVIRLDQQFLHFYNPSLYPLFLIMAIVPLAANTVTYATELKVQPEKAAVAVLASTLWALVYIPLFVTLFISEP